MTYSLNKNKELFSEIVKEKVEDIYMELAQCAKKVSIVNKHVVYVGRSSRDKTAIERCLN